MKNISDFNKAKSLLLNVAARSPILVLENCKQCGVARKTSCSLIK